MRRGGAFPFLSCCTSCPNSASSPMARAAVFRPVAKTAGNGSRDARTFVLAWDLFLFEATVSDYRSDSVRFLHLFKFGLVVLGGQPPRAGGNREIPSCFFVRVGVGRRPVRNPCIRRFPGRAQPVIRRKSPAETAGMNETGGPESARIGMVADRMTGRFARFPALTRIPPYRSAG